MTELASLLFPIIHQIPETARKVGMKDEAASYLSGEKPLRMLKLTDVEAFREAMQGKDWQTTGEIAQALGIPAQEAYNRLRGTKLRRVIEHRTSIRRCGKVIEWRLKP